MTNILSFDVDIDVKDQKMKALFEKLLGADAAVEIGFFDDTHYTTGRNRGKPITVEDVSNFNQEGDRARPFMKRAATSQKTKKALRKASENITSRKLSTHAALKVLGKVVEEQVREQIENWDGRYPNNKKSTVARKGFNKPLVETGTMKRSVKSRVIRKGKKVRGLGRYQ